MKTDLDIIRRLLDIGAIKFGEYVLKTGVTSPVYVDLRNVISYPDLLRLVSEKIWDKMTNSEIQPDLLCGVPYTALPLATAIGMMHDIPMVLRRKEVKNHGTKKILEGNYRRGQKCLILEDVVTSGSSVLETAKILREEGLVVSDCIAVVNRQQGGDNNLERNGIKLHSLFQLKDVVLTVTDQKLISTEEAQKVLTYVENTTLPDDAGKQGMVNLPFAKRAEMCSHPVLKKLFNIIHEKKSNLCVAVDVVKSSELFQFAEVLGPHICMIKTNIDILGNYSPYINEALQNVAKKHNFLILEDRKFADIGSTARLQYEEGLFRIKEWADIVSVHSVPGDGVIEGLKLSSAYNRACVLVTHINCEGNLISDVYISSTVSMAQNHKDFVIGFMSQAKLTKDPELVNIAPAVSLLAQDDPFGEMYRTPEEAIKKDGADVVIVGKAITRSRNILESVQEYKKLAFKAYLETVLPD